MLLPIATALALTSLLPTAFSYPFMERPGAVEEYMKMAKRASVQGLSSSQSPIGGFNAAAQLIDITGSHAFVAPSSTDLRGPCPGLNALANHGYLPHNGLITLTQAITATNQVFGMGIDLAGFLSAYATVIDGDPVALTWSIGGASGSGVLGGLLSQPQGLSGSHNKYESDASPGRGDSYLHNGDVSSLQVPNFQSLYALQSGGTGTNYNIDVLIQHAKSTIDYSRANNAQFTWLPFTGVVVSQAAFSFIPAFMSNHSAANPGGILDQSVLKTFFAVSGSQGSLTYSKGHERIPANWYRRPIANPYGIVEFALDNQLIQLAVPERLAVGGNLGTKGSFAGVDVSDLTGGVYNAQNLLKGNNAFCFGVETFLSVIPDVLEGLVDDVASALKLVAQYIAPSSKTFNCPALTTYDQGLYSAYPGAPKSAIL